MKRLILILTVAAILLLTCGCSATTITEHEGNYIYAQNEDINILDIDTRNNIGTLKLTGTEVLKNQPFTIQEKKGADESGNDIYEDVPYEQLVQVFYRYDNKGGKSISSLNFSAYDSAGASCRSNPDIEYSAVKRNGEEYFVVALQNKSDSVNLDFKYGLMQTTTTAKIKLSLSKNPDSTSNQDEDAGSSNTSGLSADNKSNGVTPLILYSIIGVLSLAVIGLIIVVIVQFRRKK